jgi:hypothetical protein
MWMPGIPLTKRPPDRPGYHLEFAVQPLPGSDICQEVRAPQRNGSMRRRRPGTMTAVGECVGDNPANKFWRRPPRRASRQCRRPTAACGRGPSRAFSAIASGAIPGLRRTAGPPPSLAIMTATPTAAKRCERLPGTATAKRRWPRRRPPVAVFRVRAMARQWRATKPGRRTSRFGGPIRGTVFAGTRPAGPVRAANSTRPPLVER